MQHGFRKKSTTNYLFELNNDLTKFLDDGKSVNFLTTDFSKASDKIPHKKLVHKLLNIGIDGFVFN